MDPLVYFKCIQVGKKLRVRIVSPGYNHDANCQFPRAIRFPGGCYSAPQHSIGFSQNRAKKFFYRVSKNYITVVNIDEKKEEKENKNEKKVKIKF